MTLLFVCRYIHRKILRGRKVLKRGEGARPCEELHNMMGDRLGVGPGFETKVVSGDCIMNLISGPGTSLMLRSADLVIVPSTGVGTVV